MKREVWLIQMPGDKYDEVLWWSNEEGATASLNMATPFDADAEVDLPIGGVWVRFVEEVLP